MNTVLVIGAGGVSHVTIHKMASQLPWPFLFQKVQNPNYESTH